MSETRPDPNVRYRVFGRDGEFDRIAMRELIRHGDVTSMTDVAISGSEEWRSAGFHPELQHWLALAAQSHAPATPAAAAAERSGSAKQILFGTLLIVIGIVFGASGMADLVRGIASSCWASTTDAELLDSQLVEHTSHTRGRLKTHYSVSATYRYRVGDRRYIGQTVSYGNEWFTLPVLQLRSIRGQQPLRVYYSPSRPRSSVLRPGPTTGATSTVAWA